MSKTHNTDAWLQVVPVIGENYYNCGDVIGMKVARMTQRRPNPETRIPGSVLTRVTLQIPSVVFDPIIDALVEIDPAAAEVTVTQGEL